jgi:hypothetical protein
MKYIAKTQNPIKVPTKKMVGRIHGEPPQKNCRKFVGTFVIHGQKYRAGVPDEQQEGKFRMVSGDISRVFVAST